MKKNDFILVLCIILIAGILFFVFMVTLDTNVQEVIIRVDGEIYDIVSLTEDQVIQINNTNTLEISEGQGRMIEADCPDQLCVHQSPVDRDRQSIVCLPNQVVVTVQSEIVDELDGIAY